MSCDGCGNVNSHDVDGLRSWVGRVPALRWRAAVVLAGLLKWHSVRHLRAQAPSTHLRRTTRVIPSLIGVGLSCKHRLQLYILYLPSSSTRETTPRAPRPAQETDEHPGTRLRPGPRRVPCRRVLDQLRSTPPRAHRPFTTSTHNSRPPTHLEAADSSFSC